MVASLIAVFDILCWGSIVVGMLSFFAFPPVHCFRTVFAVQEICLELCLFSIPIVIPLVVALGVYFAGLRLGSDRLELSLSCRLYIASCPPLLFLYTTVGSRNE